MTAHKNTKQHNTIATLLLFVIGIFVSSNSFAWNIGAKVGGGIVFYVYSVDGVKHGLIAATQDQNKGNPIRWYGCIFWLNLNTYSDLS